MTLFWDDMMGMSSGGPSYDIDLISDASTNSRVIKLKVQYRRIGISVDVNDTQNEMLLMIQFHFMNTEFHTHSAISMDAAGRKLA